ncbi:uncharacterized protein [Aristolochia californica]|uniref:uncharacterized protein n=1 Tax=Aristolochia californica TaxID=171875 RepID=UPI0035DF00CF
MEVEDMGEFDDFKEYDWMSIASHRRYDRNREARNRVDNNLGSIKIKIPTFQGRSDPEAYLEWEKKMELVFDCHDYCKFKKLCINRRRNGDCPIENLDEMKKVMRRRYVPSHYYGDLYLKLQGLYQGNRSVNDYYKEMGMAIIRANVKEDRDVTMARFFNCLNQEIANTIEIHRYVDFEDLVHMAIKVERQLKGGGTQPRPENSSAAPWRSNYPLKEENPSTIKAKLEPKTVTTTMDFQGKSAPISNHSSEINCFKCQGREHIASQCPNQQVIMIQENGEIFFEDEADLDYMPPSELRSSEHIMLRCLN